MQILYFLAILIGPLVKVLYNLIGNYAATMVVATIILKLLLFPLAIHQQKSMAKMSVFQPLMNEIQQKYKNNPQKQQEELMKLQQEHGFQSHGRLSAHAADHAGAVRFPGRRVLSRALHLRCVRRRRAPGL